MTPWLLICALATVVDGDTIRCGHDRVRLRHVNAPELREPGGVEAMAFLARLVDGREVRCTVFARDKYRRLVGECRTDATPSLDDAMLRGGYATPYRRTRK